MPERCLTPDKIATVTCAELRPSLELGNDRGLFRYLLNDSGPLVYCFGGSCQVLKSRSDPPPPLRQRMPGSETTFQRSRRTDTFSADSEAERHSVAVRLAVRIGEIHCGAMGKPSGINTFKSEDPCLFQARNKPSMQRLVLFNQVQMRGAKWAS